MAASAQEIFVDTDVCIDLLSGRKPFNEAVRILFSLADLGQIRIFVSSLTFSHIDYILHSQYSAQHSRQAIGSFKTIVNVLSVGSNTIDLALASGFNDFEDAIQHSCAIENNLTCIVTRNVKDYRSALVKVLTPESYLSLIH